MRRREFLGILSGAAATWPLTARAQQAVLPVIGYLSSRRSADADEVLAAFRNGLRESGFIDGQNVNIDYRWADDQYDRLPALAADLIRRRVNVIFANTSLLPAQAAKAATTTIPIVFQAGTDPVRLGLVESFNSPGGNVTGVTMFSGVVLSKRLGLLREVVPHSKNIAMLFNPASANAQIDTQDVETAARELGLTIHALPVAKAGDVDAAFAKLLARRADALLVGSDPFIDTQRHRIVALAAEHKVPAIYAWRFFVEAGGLMSYGSRIVDAYHQGGIYTARVLRGEKPADLPILQPTRFYLNLNLKTAKALGLTVPLTLQASAEEVIE
jgi:putative ABC transport system substrate-binding protein